MSDTSPKISMTESSQDFTANMLDKINIAKCIYDTIISTNDLQLVALQTIDKVGENNYTFSHTVLGNLDVADLYDEYMLKELPVDDKDKQLLKLIEKKMLEKE